jgi:hypothetical protein
MALDSHIFTISEPSIKLEPMMIPSLGEGETGDQNSFLHGSEMPYIVINGYAFQEGSIDNFVLDLNGSYPEVRCRIIDNQDVFTVDQFPRDGDTLNLKITLDVNGTYKDIRMDFTILEFRGVPTNTIKKVEGKSMFNVRAISRIPGMFTDSCQAYPEDTSINHIKSVSKELGLGFATNVTSTSDTMSRICAYEPKLDFLDKTVKYSYADDESFFTYSIDPYYYINYVNLQKIFNAPKDTEIVDLISAKNYNVRNEDTKEGAGKNQAQLLLTNHHLDSGFNHYISEFNLVNSSSKISLKNGYRRGVQFFDVYDSELKEFELEPLVSDNLEDIEEPLKGKRNSENDEYSTHIKHKYSGVQSLNMHPNYNYAYMHNNQNVMELDKMYLEIELIKVNPALYKYMKVPVAIYNYSRTSGMVDHLKTKKMKEDGFDIPEEKSEAGKDSLSNTEEQYSKTWSLDKFLTSYYVIMGIQYKYDPKKGFTQKLKLARREWPARINNI